MKKYLFFLVAITMMIVTTIQAQVPTNGLVAYYPFNGNANDSSGNGNNGTVNGASLTTDRFGNTNKAYSFNGSNNYITVPFNSKFNMQQATWNIWLKIDNASTGNGYYIFGLRDNSLHVIVLSENKGLAIGQISWVANTATTLFGDTIADGKWHMITTTYNQSNLQYSIFRDGVLKQNLTL